jgi:ketosteroid isomerase-like protein
MSEENVEIVRAILKAWNRGDYSAALELVDHNVEVEAALGLTLDGMYRGHAEGSRFLADFWGEFEDFRTEFEECIPVGDSVFVAAHHHGRGRTSGIEVEMRNWQVFTVRGGKVVRYQMFSTRQQALEAAGLEE